MMHQFGYFGIDVLMMPVWLFLYLGIVPKLKVKMLRHGTIGGVIAIMTEHIFIGDYWIPPPVTGIEGFYAPEDFLYGFLIVGIASMLYDRLFLVSKVETYPKQRKVSYLFALMVLGAFFLFSVYFGFNSTFVISNTLFIATAIMLVIRRDLAFKSILSGVLLVILFFLIYFLLFYILMPDWWYTYFLPPEKKTMLYIFNIPWVEYWWYFSLAAFMSIISDFSHGRKVTPTRLGRV